MEIIILITILSLTAISGIYLYALYLVNDFNLPELDLAKYKKTNKPLTILAAFPHPDDETVQTGGTLAKYAKLPDTKVIILCGTRGEAGETNGVCAVEELAHIREQEMRDAATILGIKEVYFLPHHDGKLQHEITALRTELDKFLLIHNPDVIFTYDSSGLYGHPDHIVMSALLRELIFRKYQGIKLMLVTLPMKMIKRMNLPQSITTKDKVLKLEHAALMRSIPKYKSSFWRLRNQKFAAIAAHRSQNLKKHYHPIPLKALAQIGWVEYFAEAS